jgi:uncharacterized membrane protein
MSKSLIAKSLVAASFISAVAALAPSVAFAQEGARSVGKGMKCYTAAVTQANGTVKIQQVCYKAI